MFYYLYWPDRKGDAQLKFRHSYLNFEARIRRQNQKKAVSPLLDSTSVLFDSSIWTVVEETAVEAGGTTTAVVGTEEGLEEGGMTETETETVVGTLVSHVTPGSPSSRLAGSLVAPRRPVARRRSRLRPLQAETEE